MFFFLSLLFVICVTLLTLLTFYRAYITLFANTLHTISNVHFIHIDQTFVSLNTKSQLRLIYMNSIGVNFLLQRLVREKSIIM